MTNTTATANTTSALGTVLLAAAFELGSAERQFRQALASAQDAIDSATRWLDNGNSINSLGVLQSSGQRTETAAASLAERRNMIEALLPAIDARTEIGEAGRRMLNIEAKSSTQLHDALSRDFARRTAAQAAAIG